MRSPFFPFFSQRTSLLQVLQRITCYWVRWFQYNVWFLFAAWLHETKSRTKTTLNLGQTATGDPMKICRVCAYNMHTFNREIKLAHKVRRERFKFIFHFLMDHKFAFLNREFLNSSGVYSPFIFILHILKLKDHKFRIKYTFFFMYVYNSRQNYIEFFESFVKNDSIPDKYNTSKNMFNQIKH